MTFDRKNGAKLAGVVLSGTLVLGGVVPVAAQLPEKVQETAGHQTEEKEEVIVFLNTSDLSENEEKGPFDEQAVQSLEEALAQFGITDEEKPQNSDEKKEQSLILVLCGETELSKEDNDLLAEYEISIMNEDSYQEMLKAREAAEKEKEEEKKETTLPEIPQLVVPGTEEKADTEETTPPPIWIAPQITITNPVESPAVNAGEATTEDTASEETITEETDEDVTEVIPVVSEQEEITEEVAEPVYTLFSFFALDDGSEETAEVVPEEEITAMALESSETAEIETTEEEIVEESHPVLFALPGIDLVGNGTSGVGGGSKPSSSKPSSNTTPSKPSSNATTSGSSASGSSSTGSSVSNTPAVSVPQTVKPSNPGVIQTSDSSNRTLWGLSAGISGAMAAFFAAQWRKLRRE